MNDIIPDAAVDIVQRFEGFREHAYKCPAGVWTIGYGHTGNVRPGDEVTTEEATTLLEWDMQAAAHAVRKYVKVPLTENQRAALISFVFNVGGGALRKSTLLLRLNAGDYDAVPSELIRWNKAGGKVLTGLVRRRAAEAELWRKP